MIDLAQRLTAIRKERGMTVDQVVASSGVTKSTASKVFSGIETNPKMETLTALLGAMGATLSDIDTDTIEKAPAQEEQELSDLDRQLLALPDDIKQTVLLLVAQAAEASAPVVRVSELTAKRIAAEILLSQESPSQDETQVAQRR